MTTSKETTGRRAKAGTGKKAAAKAKARPAKKKAAPKKPAARKKPATTKAGAAKAPSKKGSPRKPAAKKNAVASGGGKPFRWRMLWWSVKSGGVVALLFVLLSATWIGIYRYVNPPLTPLMILRNVQDEEDVRKRWRDYEDVSPEFLLSVVAAEDQLFFQHHGFDLKQIRAAIETRLDGGRLRGGSTISQQVAKNVFLWPGRSWIRKGLEAWFTVGIELCWGKERILEVYVNIAEMGEGIYGVEAAAQHYYGKPASALTREESALLAAVLPAPRDRSPAQPTDYLRQRQAWIMKQMWNLGGVRYLKDEG